MYTFNPRMYERMLHQSTRTGAHLSAKAHSCNGSVFFFHRLLFALIDADINQQVKIYCIAFDVVL